ncbi:MAG: helix-turn-helix domain-containing protein [Betaproteobacteria bacterium]|nr:helix-turn-helix domain-containing protein [Betaproteobacteria bacterium]
MTPLEQACALSTTAAHLARAVGVSPQALQQWVNRGYVPATQVLKVSAAVDYQITPHQLRPDLYPYPEDALPPIHRKMAAL